MAVVNGEAAVLDFPLFARLPRGNVAAVIATEGSVRGVLWEKGLVIFLLFVTTPHQTQFVTKDKSGWRYGWKKSLCSFFVSVDLAFNESFDELSHFILLMTGKFIDFLEHLSCFANWTAFTLRLDLVADEVIDSCFKNVS